MERKHWLLVVLGAASGKPLSQLQLQKALFLLQQAFPERNWEDYYHFKPYKYGPFDQSVYDDARQLKGQGVVSITPTEHPSVEEYAITSDGMGAANGASAQLPARMAQFSYDLVEWIRGLSFADLVNYVYTHFPEYRENSEFEPSEAGQDGTLAQRVKKLFDDDPELAQDVKQSIEAPGDPAYTIEDVERELQDA